MQSRITGTTMPVLEFALEPNETIISEAGELSWMGSSIQMTTHTQFAGGGGLFGVLKRVAGGGSIFMTEYRAYRRRRRTGVRDQASRPHRSCRSLAGARIHDPPSRISLRDFGRFRSALASSSLSALESLAATDSFCKS